MSRKLTDEDLDKQLDGLTEHGSIAAHVGWLICVILLRIEAAILALKENGNG